MVSSKSVSSQPHNEAPTTAPNIDVYSLHIVKCRYCHGTDVVKFGTYKGRQRFFCKACHRKFTPVDALPNKRFPIEQVGAALSMFYRGLSFKETGQQLAEQYHIPPPSKSTISRWVSEYTPIALKNAGATKPKVGDTWVADEVFLKVGGETLYLWDVMDAKTRFLLATRIAVNRGANDAEAVMNQAYKVAGKAPKRIITDRLKSYIDGIEKAFGADTRHVQSGGIRAETNNNLMERLQGSIRQREKVMRGLKSKETAQRIVNGWAMHYNYFRPHESLKDKTPASIAGVTLPVKDWTDVARIDVHQPARPVATSPDNPNKAKEAPQTATPATTIQSLSRAIAQEILEGMAGTGERETDFVSVPRHKRRPSRRYPRRSHGRRQTRRKPQKGYGLSSVTPSLSLLRQSNRRKL